MKQVRPNDARSFVSAIGIAIVVAVLASSADEANAAINPWIAANLYDSRRSDSAGTEAATPWLHPPKAQPNQEWGVFSPPDAVAVSDLNNLTGSWGGTRDELMRRGVGVAIAYFGQFAANPVGGEDEGGASWRGDLAASVFLDLERLLGWSRTYFMTAMDWKHGTDSLSSRYVGNQFPIQLDSFDEGSTARLANLALATQLFGNTVEVAVGRLITAEDFANLRLACTSLNQAVCATPINAGQNLSFSTFPNAVWGARVKLKPGTQWYAQVGSYLVYSGFGDSARHGIDLGTHTGAGALTMVEAGYIAGSGPGFLAEHGVYKIGGYYDSEQVTDQESQSAVHGTGGLYVMGEQHLWPRSAAFMDGLSAWGAFSWAPPDRNQLEYMVSGGVLYTTRKNRDGAALLFAYGQYSDDLRRGQRSRRETVQTGELLLEVNYRHSFAPWLWVQPDIQGVIQPDGRSETPDALVIGFALGLVF